MTKTSKTLTHPIFVLKQHLILDADAHSRHEQQQASSDFRKTVDRLMHQYDKRRTAQK